jgi:hypothetical protein
MVAYVFIGYICQATTSEQISDMSEETSELIEIRDWYVSMHDISTIHLKSLKKQ